jgi:RNA polymerase sigma-B factor
MTLLKNLDVAPVMRARVPRPVPERDDYADVPDMLRCLATFSQGSAARGCQREAVVMRCLPLAEHIARRFANRGIELDDLVQVARVGLMGAIDRFDVVHGSHFVSFAVPTITGEVRRHFRDRGWVVRVPRRLKDLNLAVTSSIPDMTQRLGRAPTATELATELDIDREEVVQTLVARDCYRPQSLDAPKNSTGDPDTVASTVGGNEAGYELVVNREALRVLISRLGERERDVLGMRFFESLTQSQIAERIGVSQMQVSRILAQVLGRLRNEMG